MALKQVQKAFNEVYRSFNATQSPFVVADFISPSGTSIPLAIPHRNPAVIEIPWRNLEGGMSRCKRCACMIQTLQ